MNCGCCCNKLYEKYFFKKCAVNLIEINLKIFVIFSYYTFIYVAYSLKLKLKLNTCDSIDTFGPL